MKTAFFAVETNQEGTAPIAIAHMPTEGDTTANLTGHLALYLDERKKLQPPEIGN